MILINSVISPPDATPIMPWRPLGCRGALRNALFFLETRIVGRDTLREHVVPIGWLQPVQRPFLSQSPQRKCSKNHCSHRPYRNLGRFPTCSRVLYRRRSAAALTTGLSDTSPPRQTPAAWRRFMPAVWQPRSRREKRGSPGEGPAPFYVSSYLVPRSSSRARRRASLFSTMSCVPSGMERVSASTSLATVGGSSGRHRRRARRHNLSGGAATRPSRMVGLPSW